MSPPEGASRKVRGRVERLLARRFESELVRLVQRAGPRRLLEVDCGEGETLLALAQAGIRSELHGVDARPEAIANARERLEERATLRIMDTETLETKAAVWDLVMLHGTLARLEDPGAMLSTLARISHRYVLVSAPHAPLLRTLNLAQGRHLTRLGHAPAHRQRWGRREFIDWVGTRFRILEAPVVPPWTLVLAETIH